MLMPGGKEVLIETTDASGQGLVESSTVHAGKLSIFHNSIKGGKDATLADLKPDDMVVVVAKKGDGDALTAVKITVA
jgi:hypothetical protein